ncbi:hypothetical protein EsDP_00002010 [Epichloe bromicola]|uniref:Monopolin complex subunit Csm1/Pcs1 C-terminal domain-containing protein n=1 Tax=Epichloe bromicola TaxID=79588 RepID=A0ABQ0CJI2_9HYPO
MPLPRVTGGFASMMMSDSEPDFDDVETIEVLPSREMNKNSATTATGNNKRPGNNANRVTKPAQRHGRSNNSGGYVSHPATARQILGERTNNHSLTGTLNDKHKPFGRSESYDGGGLVTKEEREHHDSKRPDETTDDLEDINKHIHYIDGNIANDQNLQPMDVDDHTDAAVASSEPQEVVGSKDMKIKKSACLYDSAECAMGKELTELKRKYDVLEARHVKLRDVGVKAAECNFERLKRQSKETAAASAKLISELKAELAIQSGVIKQNEQIGRQLERSEASVGELEKTIADLTASLLKARSEIKSMSAKLSASRAVGAGANMPANMTKTATGGSISTPSGVVLAAKAKEDLYGDLTGLIVRGTSQINGEDVFDCIQTGRNGTLHFKLALEAGDDAEKYDEVQFTYRPQLDAERDRDLVMVLPDYLVEDITFTRTQASNFYSKLNKSLTGRLH